MNGLLSVVITKNSGLYVEDEQCNRYKILLGRGEDEAKMAIVSFTRFSFNPENWSLKTQMWVPQIFSLFRGTQNEIPGSFVPKTCCLNIY